ncbi:hypothetical protein FJY69_05075 [candidate division WOR-3 bacterium]|nr:hypothetical protein [candidate division WOR-3 bacterium]
MNVVTGTRFWLWVGAKWRDAVKLDPEAPAIRIVRQMQQFKRQSGLPAALQAAFSAPVQESR